MDSDVERRIATAVREVLEESDMNETTEYQVRKQASERLGMDLSQPKLKAVVRRVVQSFLEEQKAKEDQAAIGAGKEEEEEGEEEEQEEEEEEAGKKSGGDAEYTEDGDLIICKVVPFLWSCFSFFLTPFFSCNCCCWVFLFCCFVAVLLQKFVRAEKGGSNVVICCRNFRCVACVEGYGLQNLRTILVI